MCLQVKVEGETSERYTELVGKDNFYLQYIVKVGAYNKFGDGPNSTERLIMSAEGSKYAYRILYESCQLI